MNVVSTYFALWVTKDHGASDLTYGLAKSLSMGLVVVIAPVLGALSDRHGLRKPFLVVTALSFIAATFALGFAGPLWLGLLLYGLGNIGYQLSNVFYNALLPALSPPETMGRISGYARALGYVGSLTAVLLGMAFATGKLLGHPVGLPAGGSSATFVPTALLVLAASLPILFMREPKEATEAAHVEAPGALLAGLRELFTEPAYRGAALFMVGSFFFFDTINTIRDFMSVYLVKVVGLSETGGSLQSFLMAVVLCSLVGALGWGFLADRTTPKTSLVGVLLTLAVGFTLAATITTKSLVLSVVAPIVGLGFGGVLVATRPLLTQLVPPERRGLFFGLFVLANDAAAIIGPVTWGLVVKALDGRGAIAYQAALGTQLLFLLVGLAFVLKVPDPGQARR